MTDKQHIDQLYEYTRKMESYVYAIDQLLDGEVTFKAISRITQHNTKLGELLKKYVKGIEKHRISDEKEV